MAQIGQLLEEYTLWLKEQGYMLDTGGPGREPLSEVRTDFAVKTFLESIEHREWMPTTGAESEEAEPEPDAGIVDIDGVITYCEGIALNEAAATPVRLKAAEVVMRWYDTVAYLDKEDAVEVRQGPWPFLPGQRAPQIPTEPRGY